MRGVRGRYKSGAAPAAIHRGQFIHPVPGESRTTRPGRIGIGCR